MSDVTRNLASFALSRNVPELVTAIIKTVVPAGDGSYTSTKIQTAYQARVVDLQPTELKRLQDRNFSINSGYSVAIVGELAKAPDQFIRASNQLLKVIDFTIAEGISVFVCDAPPSGKAPEVVI